MGRAEPHAVLKDGINDHVVHGARDGQPGRGRHQGAAALRARSCRRRHRDRSGCGSVRRADSATPPTRSPTPRGSSPTRIAEADAFYAALAAGRQTRRGAVIQRQAFAGLMWGKQFYHFDVGAWLDGDPGRPAAARRAASTGATATGGT